MFLHHQPVLEDRAPVSGLEVPVTGLAHMPGAVGRTARASVTGLGIPPDPLVVHRADPGRVVGPATVLDAAPARITEFLLIVHAAPSVVVRPAQPVEDGQQRAGFPPALLIPVLLSPPLLVMLPAHSPGVLNIHASLNLTPPDFHATNLA